MAKSTVDELALTLATTALSLGVTVDHAWRTYGQSMREVHDLDAAAWRDVVRIARAREKAGNYQPGRAEA